MTLICFAAEPFELCCDLLCQSYEVNCDRQPHCTSASPALQEGKTVQGAHIHLLHLHHHAVLHCRVTKLKIFMTHHNFGGESVTAGAVRSIFYYLPLRGTENNFYTKTSVVFLWVL